MAHTFSCSADAPLVRTTGGSARGYRFDGLDIFKGIPYAKARRFHAPEPAMWDGVLDATSYGYVCPLLEMPKPNGEMLVPHRYWLMDEACQNLNIWTPALANFLRFNWLPFFEEGGAGPAPSWSWKPTTWTS